MKYNFYFAWKFWKYILGIKKPAAGYVLLRYKDPRSIYQERVEDTLYSMSRERDHGIVPVAHADKLQQKAVFKRYK